MTTGGDERRVAAVRFLRYCVVGGIGTIVHFGLTIALVEALGAGPVVATAVGFVGALLVSFALNRRFVFAFAGPVAPSLARYVVVSLTGFALNVAIMAGVVDVLRADYRWGLALVVLIIPLVNFTMNARWTFR